MKFSVKLDWNIPTEWGPIEAETPEDAILKTHGNEFWNGRDAQNLIRHGNGAKGEVWVDAEACGWDAPFPVTLTAMPWDEVYK